MSTPSNVPSDSFAPQPAPAATSPTHPLYWSLQREFWEHRSIYLAPLAAAALFLFGFMISLIHLPSRIRAAGIDPMQHDFIVQSENLAALLIMGTTLIVAVFYCLDALHSERRDRSILFWKSLPVSDLTTVLSKASIPIVILPFITFGVTIALWILMVLLSNAVLLASGTSAAPAPHFSFFQLSTGLFYHLMVVHGLFYAPFYGWLLLVSAWARRATFLWATLPLFAIGIVEKIAFNTSYFASMLGYRLGGGAEDNGSKATGMAVAFMPHFTSGQFIFNPSLWTGLAMTAIFLAAAIRLRRNREPI
ncbi:MAG: ABC transporter permease [Candidatus Sulfotelmatobacter sp.]